MPGTPFTVPPCRKVSASATVCRMHGNAGEPFARFSLLASRWPARQPIASWGLLLLQFIAWKTCEAMTMLATEKLPNDFGRYWIAHGPLVLQLPPYFERFLQSAEKNGPFELEFAMWFFQ